MRREGYIKNNQSGLGMIEILVALLILSIGLLGLAGMQVTSTKMTSMSQQKTQAMILANDMVERVRANRANAGAYDNTDVSSGDRCETDFTAPGGNVAANDEAEWTNSVRCLLADGRGDVSVDAGDKEVTVNMQWETRMAADDDAFVEDQGKLKVTARY